MLDKAIFTHLFENEKKFPHSSKHYQFCIQLNYKRKYQYFKDLKLSAQMSKCLDVQIIKYKNTMGDAFSKDGVLTQLIECLPGGGLLTAPFHFAAGNNLQGGLAAGFGLLSVIPGGSMAKGGQLAIKGGKALSAGGKALSAGGKALSGVKGGVKLSKATMFTRIHKLTQFGKNGNKLFRMGQKVRKALPLFVQAAGFRNRNHRVNTNNNNGSQSNTSNTQGNNYQKEQINKWRDYIKNVIRQAITSTSNSSSNKNKKNKIIININFEGDSNFRQDRMSSLIYLMDNIIIPILKQVITVVQMEFKYHFRKKLNGSGLNTQNFSDLQPPKPQKVGNQYNINVLCIGWSQFQHLLLDDKYWPLNTTTNKRQFKISSIIQLSQKYISTLNSKPYISFFIQQKSNLYIPHFCFNKGRKEQGYNWRNKYNISVKDYQNYQNTFIQHIKHRVNIFTNVKDMQNDLHLGSVSKILFSLFVFWKILPTMLRIICSEAIGYSFNQSKIQSTRDGLNEPQVSPQNTNQQHSINRLQLSIEYQAGQLLGQGTAAQILQNKLNNSTVIKKFFKQETYKLQKSNHKKIKEILQTDAQLRSRINLYQDASDKEKSIILPLMNGLTLEQYIVDYDIDIQTARKWSDYLLDTLARLHKRGIGHGDFKAKNLMVNDGQLMICDLGLVHIMESNSSRRIDNRTLEPTNKKQNSTLVNTIQLDFQQLIYIIMQLYFGIAFKDDENVNSEQALMWPNKIRQKDNFINTHDLNPGVYQIPQINSILQTKPLSQKIVKKFIREMFPLKQQCTQIQSEDGKFSILVPINDDQSIRKKKLKDLSQSFRKQDEDFIEFKKTFKHNEKDKVFKNLENQLILARQRNEQNKKHEKVQDPRSKKQKGDITKQQPDKRKKENNPLIEKTQNHKPIHSGYKQKDLKKQKEQKNKQNKQRPDKNKQWNDRYNCTNKKLNSETKNVQNDFDRKHKARKQQLLVMVNNGDITKKEYQELKRLNDKKLQEKGHPPHLNTTTKNSSSCIEQRHKARKAQLLQMLNNELITKQLYQRLKKENDQELKKDSKR